MSLKDLEFIANAAEYAERAHSGQARKYNGKPYITHPARVAYAVAAFSNSTTEMIAAAWLHDTIEDCGKTFKELKRLFGHKVATLVEELTNPSTGSTAPRAVRKAQDLAHLATISVEVKLIKLVDRLDNLQEIEGGKPSFITLYCKESLGLLDVLKGTNPRLESAISTRVEELTKWVENRK